VCTHVEKATLLTDRFFPNSVVDFIDVTDTTFSRDIFLADPLVLLQTVTADDVK
jgi:lipoprotein signal peptidase